MAGKVDVLAVMDRFIGSVLPSKLWDGANPYCNQPGREGSDYANDLGGLCAARAATAELIAAATEVRDAAWGPDKTDQPHIVRLDAALAALSNMEAR